MFKLIVVLVLLVLGYFVGSYREKKHFQSIFEREEELQDILLFDTKSSANLSSDSGGELVHGNVVISVDYFKSFVAGLRKLIGGPLRSYETLMDRGRREAILRMKYDAKNKGANQIVNVKIETASISKGAKGNIGSVEVFAYGSAIKS